MILTGWKDVSGDDTSSEPQISLALMEMTSKGPVVAVSICIHEDFSWQLYVQRKVIEPCSPALPRVLDSVSALEAIISYVSSCNICCGNSDEKFLPLANCRKGKFMDSSGIVKSVYKESFYKKK